MVQYARVSPQWRSTNVYDSAETADCTPAFVPPEATPQTVAASSRLVLAAAEPHHHTAEGLCLSVALPSLPVQDAQQTAVQGMPLALRPGRGASSSVCAGPIAVGSPQQLRQAAAAPRRRLDGPLRMVPNCVWLSTSAALHHHSALCCTLQRLLRQNGNTCDHGLHVALVLIFIGHRMTLGLFVRPSKRC